MTNDSDSNPNGAVVVGCDEVKIPQRGETISHVVNVMMVMMHEKMVRRRAEDDLTVVQYDDEDDVMGFDAEKRVKSDFVLPDR